MYKHVIWDWNGTLLNDAWLCVDIVNNLLKKRGFPNIDLEKYQDKFDFPVKKYYQRLGFDFTKDPFEILAYEFVTEYNKRRNECELQEGVRQITAHLDRKGIAQYILSAYDQKELEKAIEYYGIGKYFKKIYGPDNHHAEGKIEIGKKLGEEIGVRDGDIVLVGDTTHDYLVSKELGIECILIPCGHQKREKLLTCGAKVISKLTEITTVHT